MKGVFAAVATPVHEDGRLDDTALDRLLDFLVGAGVDGVCVGGATGEYPHFETAERAVVIRRAARRLPSGSTLLAGIGAPTFRRTVELGRLASDAGCRALLLPMPMFFRYAQDDLEAYCAQASRAVAAPCFLYDLPEFTNPLAPATALALLEHQPFIAGLKDSSGREENLGTFASARGARPWTLLVGDDRLLARGLEAGWDGGISGVAGFCPELLVALARSAGEGRRDETARLGALLDELIARIAVFPAPWGIRLGLAARGLGTGPLPLPLAPARVQQAREFQAWFAGWLASIPNP